MSGRSPSGNEKPFVSFQIAEGSYSDVLANADRVIEAQVPFRFFD